MSRILALLLGAALVVTGCSGDPEPEPTPTPTPTPTTPSPTPTPDAAFPLTGETTDDPRLDQPVLAVKIDNSPAAQPHAGLDEADVVFEQIVEGGVTRYAALFHSTIPDVIGPVRSGRLLDLHLMEPWSSVFAYSGARNEVTSTLRSAEQIGLLADTGPPLFTRESGRSGTHNLMLDGPGALERADDLDGAGPVPDDVPWAFEEEPPSGGEDAEEFDVRMTSSARVTWTWDEQAGAYRRTQNGSEARVTGDGQLGPSTVVAILTDIGTGGCCDTAGNPYVTTRLEGEGDAVVWRDGQRYEASWHKDDAASFLEVHTPDGETFPFAPGPTWFHLTNPSAVGATL